MPTARRLPPLAKKSKDDGSLLAKYRIISERLENDLRNKTLMPSDVAKLTASLKGVYERIGRLTGEGEVTEAQILKSRAWKRILRKLEPAMRAHPKAARDFVAALSVDKESNE